MRSIIPRRVGTARTPEADAVRIDTGRLTITVTADQWFDLIDEARRQGLRDDQTDNKEPHAS